jgi:oligopeptide/dipeptide ABC transporter ATP-binding protein
MSERIDKHASLPLLEIVGLTVSYRLETGKIYALFNVDLEVGRREIIGIVGESGSGKSTLAKAILAYAKPPAKIEKGRILFQGKDVLSLKEDELRKLRFGRISVVPQGTMNAFNPVIKLNTQMAETLKEKVDRKTALKKAEHLFELVGLKAKFLQKYPHQLSGGEKQRASFAMALMNNPSLVILDEPTSALDALNQTRFIQLLVKLSEEMNISWLFFTHDIALASNFCSRLMVLYCGQFVEEDESALLWNNPLHPYTKGLIESLPKLGDAPLARKPIAGYTTPLTGKPRSCIFSARCTMAQNVCYTQNPKYLRYGGLRKVRCFMAKENYS